MNRTASKLLTSYATATDRNRKDVKRWWKSLSWQERTLERKRIEQELGTTSSEEASSEE